MKLTDIIRRPLITEKTTLLREAGRTVVFEVAAARDQGRHQARGREAARLEGRGGAHVDLARQVQAAGALHRPAVGLEEGLREAARRGEDPRVPGGRVRAAASVSDQLQRSLLTLTLEAEASRIIVMPIRKYNPTSPGPPVPDGAGVRRHHRDRAVQAADRAAAEVGRPQQPRRADVLVARRRPQARTTASSTSSATRRAFRPRCRRSSTTRTGRRGSRC